MFTMLGRFVTGWVFAKSPWGGAGAVVVVMVVLWCWVGAVAVVTVVVRVWVPLLGRARVVVVASGSVCAPTVDGFVLPNVVMVRRILGGGGGAC